MKKFTFMRLACVLLVAVMLSTCAISGTFAKYTTSAAGTSSARVAYWGFKIFNNVSSITIDDLFANAYIDTPDTTDNATVKSENVDNVIAPGTTNSATFKFLWIEGQSALKGPEVDYTFKVSTGNALETTCAEEIQSNPNIQWRLNVSETEKGAIGETEPTKTEGEWGTWAKLIENIEGLDGNKEGDRYEAGTLPEAFDNMQTYEIEWRWIFETPNADNGPEDNLSEMAIQDHKDTDMANKDVLGSVKLTIYITATQID